MTQIQQHRLKALTSKFFEQGLTSKEREELLGFFRDQENLSDFRKEYFLRTLEAPGDDQIEASWQKVQDQISNKNPEYASEKRNTITIWTRIRPVAVAVVAFALGAAACYFFAFNLKNPTLTEPINTLVSNTLNLSNKITAPLGSMTKIELPDGSQVTLNAGSTLEYNMDYGLDCRKVKLEGEAYFKVAKKDSCLFTVMAKDAAINALGTEFNVKAYPDESFVQTTLVNGSVSINPNINSTDLKKEILLQPSQMLTIRKEFGKEELQQKNKRPALKNTPEEKNPEGEIIQKAVVDPALYTSWKDPRWIIQEEELESLAQKLQRRYDVNVVIASPVLKKYKFSGILEDETLEQVMDIMKSIAPINYYIDKKTVVLAVNPDQRKVFEKSMN